VRFAGLIGSSLGYKEKVYEIAEGTTINELLEAVGLPVDPSWTMVGVNGVIRDKKTVLKDGDELLVMPVGGGG